MTNTPWVLFYHMNIDTGNDTTRQQQIQQYSSTSQLAISVAKRILIVSSEDDVNFAFKLALEEKDEFLVDCFDNPISALKFFKKGVYDLLIIDIVMPEMNGFELSEKLRTIDEKINICFLTAGEVPSKVRFDTSSREGIGYQDKFIRLPIENKVLMEQIDRIITCSF